MSARRSPSDHVLPLPVRRAMLVRAFRRLAEQVAEDEATIDEAFRRLSEILMRCYGRDRAA